MGNGETELFKWLDGCAQADDGLFARTAALVREQSERIAELEAQQRWIPVSERWPEFEQLVLAIGDLDRMQPTNDLAVSEFRGFDGDEPYWTHIGFDPAPHVVTHWMPLPPPPTGEQR